MKDETVKALSEWVEFLDRVTAEIKNAEDVLRKSGASIEVFFEVDDGTKIGWCQFGDKFRICVITDELKPALEASVPLKLIVAERLGDLMNALILRLQTIQDGFSKRRARKA